MPTLPREVQAKGNGVVYLGIGKRLMPAFIPSGAEEDAESRRQFLLNVQAHAILVRTLMTMRDHIRRAADSGPECSDSFKVVAHICGIAVEERADHGMFLRQQ